MSIVGITPRVQEVGRIRMGDKNDRNLPVSLSTFRLTSYDKEVLLAAAERYGGEVREWQDAPDPGMWEVITAASALDILIPRSLNSVSQFWELWQGGVCERRCDGRTEEISGGACICGDARGTTDDVCDVVTRLSVVLPDLPGLGLWRLDTGGYYAATTIPSTLDFLLTIDQRPMVPAVLRAVQRSAKVRQTDGKVITRRFVMPVLSAPGITIGQMVEIGEHAEPQQLPESLDQPRRLTAAERVAAQAAALSAPGSAPEPAGTGPVAQQVDVPVPAEPDEPVVRQAQGEAGAGTGPAPSPVCGSPSPYDDGGSCTRAAGHAQTVMCTDGNATWPRPKDWK